MKKIPFSLKFILSVVMQKAQRSYQKDVAKFEEAKESHALDVEGDDQGCK